MKTLVVIIMAALSVAAYADTDKDVAAVAAANPDAKTIVKTSYGYRIETEKGTRFVNETSYGFRSDTGGKTVVINKTAAGYRVTTSR